MSEKLVKLTEIDGEHCIGETYDYLWSGCIGTTTIVARLAQLLPGGSLGKRGTFRVTVEFTPEDE